MKLVNGLENMEIHNYVSKINERLMLLQLFCAINCLSPKNKEKAYENVLNKCHLSFKAEMNFTEMKSNYIDKHSNINVLRRIIRLYNNSYNDKVFI